MATNVARRIRPLGERVLVEPKAVAERSSGGLIIPEAAQEQPMEGTVLEVGEYCNAGLRGASVLYGKYSGTEITEAGVTYLILKDADILAVLE